jgi:two-component system sensor histidine kinase YesM
MRFNNKIEIQFGKVPEEAATFRVPRLFLQPIIENSFKHALEKVLKGGLLIVTFEQEAHALIIVIEDNGGITEEEAASLRDRLDQVRSDEETTGLINVHQRLILHYGKEAGLRLSVGSLTGLRIEIHLPNRR